jgi:cytochrome P450
MPKGVMMMEDPPVHTMLRGLMSRVFTPRRMAEIEDQIRRYCVNCLIRTSARTVSTSSPNWRR